MLYSCTVHILFSYTVFLLYFPYDSHILCFSSYTIIYYTFIYCTFIYCIFIYYIFIYCIFIYCTFIYCTFILSVIYIFVSLTLYFLYLYTCHILFSFIYCTVHIFFMYCTFHILSSCTFSSCSYNCLYFHRIAVLCFSYHVFYTCHFILGFMSAYTLEVDMGITVCTRRYYHCTRQ